jgi:hypothetical protein
MMFPLAPIEKGFVPYSRRAARKNNAGLFIGGGRRGAVASVSLQAYRNPDCPAGVCCGFGLRCNSQRFCDFDPLGTCRRDET